MRRANRANSSDSLNRAHTMDLVSTLVAIEIGSPLNTRADSTRNFELAIVARYER